MFFFFNGISQQVSEIKKLDSIYSHLGDGYQSIFIGIDKYHVFFQGSHYNRDG
jgi:TorA maturation chaperone TorD